MTHTTGQPFGARLRAALDSRGPLCVGIDPHPNLLDGWGVGGNVAGLESFALGVVDAIGDQVAMLKPQSAFFERFGSAGVAVLERTVAAARQAGALVLLDVKRGDIGSTVAAYASAYLDPASPLAVDAITASPYLGYGSLRPLVDTALAHDNGVFVLALTSNPEGGAVQRAVGPDGRTVAQTIVDEVAAVNSTAVATGSPMGSVGVVVGATVGQTGHDLSRLAGPILAPGLGAQGASAADLRAVFGEQLDSVVPSISRGVLRAGPGRSSLRAAVESSLTELRTALAVPAGR